MMMMMMMMMMPWQHQHQDSGRLLGHDPTCRKGDLVGFNLSNAKGVRS